ncbi:MAG: F0F1 ATP synthase subunit delta [Desulfurivibrionaceae bacterium]|nr:F0F1 ATP synthase subunit delta [Desulfobulbales bacterium]MDT8334753.1 F0F1 ATP synthase subunit delta [Desulfurivibrionaceae bacterium]
MLIDWFTVIAQIINFLILMGLLKYFLYDRLIAIMDERQRKIDERLTASEETKKAAEEEKQELAEARREFDERKKAMLDEAHEEAGKWRRDKISEARGEVEKLRERWREDLEREKKSFGQHLKELIGRETYAMAASFFADLGDRELEGRLGNRFVEMVRELEPEAREALVAGTEKNGGTVAVVSAFELDDNTRQAIEKVCAEIIDREHRVRFTTSSEVIMGVELQVAGYRISLSLRRYLTMLEDQLQAIFASRKGDEHPEKKESSGPAKNTGAADDSGGNGD